MSTVPFAPMSTTDHLPTFVLVGAMKAGTTSLHHYLDAHPQICMSRPKEPNFFTAQSERDLDWYRQCFQEEAREYGESSTNYTKYPGVTGVPERMHRLLPDVKLLYLVRDPVERALSHYQHNCIHGRAEGTVEEELLPVEESHYLQTSRYYMQISRYLKCYSRDQILVIESEKLRAERSQVMTTIFEFLGVETAVDASEFEKEHHATSKKLTPRVSSFLRETQVGKVLMRTGQTLLPEALVDRGLDVFRTNVERPSLEGAVKQRMYDYLRDDVEQLRAFCGEPFDRWL